MSTPKDDLSSTLSDIAAPHTLGAVRDRLQPETKPAHTPGPWRLAGASSYSGDDLNIDAGTRGYVALCGKRGDLEAEANARLIAAAPELLAACQKAATCASLPDYVADLIRAAIATATK